MPCMIDGGVGRDGAGVVGDQQGAAVGGDVLHPLPLDPEPLSVDRVVEPGERCAHVLDRPHSSTSDRRRWPLTKIGTGAAGAARLFQASSCPAGPAFLGQTGRYRSRDGRGRPAPPPAWGRGRCLPVEPSAAMWRMLRPQIGEGAQCRALECHRARGRWTAMEPTSCALPASPAPWPRLPTPRGCAPPRFAARHASPTCRVRSCGGPGGHGRGRAARPPVAGRGGRHGRGGGGGQPAHRRAGRSRPGRPVAGRHPARRAGRMIAAGPSSRPELRLPRPDPPRSLPIRRLLLSPF